MGSEPHPDPEKRGGCTQPARKEGRFQGCQAGDHESQRVWHPSVAAPESVESANWRQLASATSQLCWQMREGKKKSNRCESSVDPAAVFCNIMSIDLLFVPEFWGRGCSAVLVNPASLPSQLLVRGEFLHKSPQSVSQGTLGQRYSVVI